MELDLRQIARVRTANHRQPGTMNYLLSPIRRELEERINAGNAGNKDKLIIDFLNGDILQNQPGVTRYSLLESSGNFDFEDQSFDCVVINLQSSWLDFGKLINRVKPLLRPGGSLYFSAFGPDTLGEIRYGWAQADEFVHVHPFIDMHHLGDALLKTGFVKPIVDADWIYVDYPDIDVLFEDLKLEGFINICSNRRKTLTGKSRFKKFEQGLIDIAAKGDQINITYEMIYGYAELSDLVDGSIRVIPPAVNS